VTGYPESLGDTDVKIIQHLQKYGRMSVKELGALVYLSSPAVSARLDRLKRGGVLVGWQAVFDNQKLGNTIKAFINLEVEPLQKSEFYPYIQSIPNVVA
jgi:Lrp/AsnC family leucine-responsive transcriptional regulator